MTKNLEQDFSYEYVPLRGKEKGAIVQERRLLVGSFILFVEERPLLGVWETVSAPIYLGSPLMKNGNNGGSPKTVAC